MNDPFIISEWTDVTFMWFRQFLQTLEPVDPDASSGPDQKFLVSTRFTCVHCIQLDAFLDLLLESQLY